ncbi:hypothetical protein O0544_23145 [Edwardsiella anguillarum]|nr:hypothetical protein [Edwardsiella anguillarum]
MQLTSFVSQAAIAQMRDAEIVSRHCISRYPDCQFSALVPNFHGARLAQACGYREITPVISLSETHNLKNVNKTHRQSLDEIARIRQHFPDLRIVQDIATVFGCPYEGRMATPPLLALIAALAAEGIDEFTLCDTIGVAYPGQVLSTLNAVRAAFPAVRLNIHIHDTRNMGIINSYLAATWPVDAIQTSLGDWAAAPLRRAPPAIRPRRIWFTCCTRRGWRPGSILPVCWPRRSICISMSRAATAATIYTSAPARRTLPLEPKA